MAAAQDPARTAAAPPPGRASGRPAPARRPSAPRTGRSRTTRRRRAAFSRNAVGPNSSNNGPARTKPTIRPASVAASKRATALPRRISSAAVAKAMKPEDRRHGGGGRRALEEAGEADDGEADGERGDDHGDGAEPGAEQHDPPVPDAVGQDPEQRRGDELGEVEQGAEDSDRARVDRLAAVLRERGVVVDEHRARDPGRESQRERAEDHREDGTRHARSVAGTAPWSLPHRRPRPRPRSVSSGAP